jgi:uncharacterized protein YjbI with pentapeptide repeats
MTRAAVAVAVAAALLVEAAPAAAGGRITGSQVEALLISGKPVVLDRVQIIGPIDLRTAAVVSVPFVCTRCTFTSSVVVPHVRFTRGLNLSGSAFQRAVDFSGAVFEDAAIFGTPDSGGAKFLKKIDFSFATFDDFAQFAGVTFVAPADFSSAHFRAAARFDSAAFSGTATFDGATFDSLSDFGHGEFAETASFAGVGFDGNADFRGRTFGGTATFDDAAFASRSDFSQAMIEQPASFDDARFGDDAAFRGTGVSFKSTNGQPGVSFDHATVVRHLDFDGAVLNSPVQLGGISAGSVSFAETDFSAEPFAVYADKIDVDSLSIDLSVLPRVYGRDAQMSVLRRVEATAKDRGDLGLANDARYRLQEIASGDDSLPRRIGDVVLYRTIAGYFVRPLRPLAWLVGVILLAAAVRVFRQRRKRAVRRPLGRLFRLGKDYLDALAATVTPGPPKKGAAMSILRRLELTTYAVLLFCFLVALANTNPTLRQMVDAVFKM